MATILPSVLGSVPATALDQDPHRNRSSKPRRRVKTGCLTCRKRRIKCGEQKPVCFNCRKSKRDCDWNNQIVFNPPEVTPTGDYLQYSNLPVNAPQQYTTPEYRPYRPPPTPQTPAFYSETNPLALSNAYQSALPYQSDIFVSHAEYAPSAASYPGLLQTHPSSRPAQPPGQTSTWSSSAFAYNRAQDYGPRVLPPPPPQWQGSVSGAFPAQWETTPPSAYPPYYERSGAVPESSVHSGLVPQTQVLLSSGNAEGRYDFSRSEPIPGSNTAAEQIALPLTNANYLLSDHGAVLDMAAVEMQDDDYYDVIPEEEDENELYKSVTGVQDAHGSAIQHDSNWMLQSYAPSPNNLTFYSESQAASPLRNKATQMIFKNFIWNTAPALSICERPASWAHRIAPPHGMSGSPMSCWMDVLPTMAIQDPGLLHAMLAQSSYEIAKTSGASSTSSVKHHVWSMKRVHRALGSPQKRHQVTTLAATLLLGFYEILTADHLKWSTHLSGARHLIMETDFRGMTNEIRRRLRAADTARTQSTWGDTHAAGMGDDPTASLHALCDTDEALVEQIMGFKVSISERQERRQGRSNTDLANFATRQDLFWWFCKQDAYHSMISGNDLLLPYHRWADCPPRATIGRLDAVYGSNDYVVLLLGRVASFAANDRPRKIRASKSRTPPPPSSAAAPLTPMTPSPPFYGMAPSSGQPQGPAAYGSDVIGTVSNDRHMQSTAAQVEALTSQANAEWDDLRAACDMFVHRLGVEFQPLTQEEHPSFDTPFGPSCHFRSLEVANLWMMYYTVLLVLIRAHPSKPAASQMSVGVSARETTWYANEIGRIAASITAPAAGSPPYFKYLGVSTGSVVPLFFAGVQYQDAQQRHWTVKRLWAIASRTGWTSAETCANGCQTSWIRTAEMGRGAPWTRMIRDPYSPDQRSSGRYLHKRGGQLVESNDRRLLHYQPDTRLTWGFGLLGTIEDLGHMSIND